MKIYYTLFSFHFYFPAPSPPLPTAHSGCLFLFWGRVFATPRSGLLFSFSFSGPPSPTAHSGCLFLFWGRIFATPRSGLLFSFSFSGPPSPTAHSGCLFLFWGRVFATLRSGFYFHFYFAAAFPTPHSGITLLFYIISLQQICHYALLDGTYCDLVKSHYIGECLDLCERYQLCLRTFHTHQMDW